MTRRTVTGLIGSIVVSAIGCGSGVSDATTGAGGAAGTAAATGTGAGGATGTGTASGGGSGTTTATSTATSSSTGTGGGCGPCMDFECCGAACVNKANDIHNCGSCGNVCPGPAPYCDNGTCGTPPCDPSTGCAGGQLCCATQCCAAGQLCCTVPGPVGDTTACQAPTAEGTCPTGCTSCVCASPDTPIATPSGDRPIASLAVGDLVYSVDGAALRAVPILEVHRVAAPNHRVVRVVLESGAVLEISPAHPTADGRTFAQLAAGDRLDGVAVVEARTIPYRHAFTHDVLPASDTGTYVAGGVVIGSTLRGVAP